MFRNILVAIDGSPDSAEALDQAIDLAESERARLTLLTAVAKPASAYWGWSAPVAVQLVDGARADATSILASARDRVPGGVPVTTILTEAPIRTALIAEIKRGRHDLMMMGSRGRGAVRSALLGSVSHYVLNHSHVPVLIAHAERANHTGESVASTERPQLVGT